MLKRPLALALLLFCTNKVLVTSPPESESEEETSDWGCSSYSLIPALYYFYCREPKFSLFRFHVNGQHNSILNHPNKINTIRFDNEVLEFDDQAILPTYSTWSLVTIYTSKRGTPLLVDIFGYYGYTFYSPDPETNKWINKKMDRFADRENVDENGVSCYKFDTGNNYPEFLQNISHEFDKLPADVLGDNPPNDTDSQVPDYPYLHISVNLYEKGLDLPKSGRQERENSRLFT